MTIYKYIVYIYIHVILRGIGLMCCLLSTFYMAGRCPRQLSLHNFNVANVRASTETQTTYPAVLKEIRLVKERHSLFVYHPKKVVTASETLKVLQIKDVCREHQGREEIFQ